MLKKKVAKTLKTENWHPEDADPDNPKTTFKRPPQKYQAGYLQKLDRRTAAFQILHDSYSETANDLGGEESLSHVQRALIERFCFLEFVLMGLEQRIARNPKKSEVLLGRFIQGLNSLQGLARNIGLERRTRKAVNLKNYIADQTG